jgi:hypothetical protein
MSNRCGEAGDWAVGLSRFGVAARAVVFALHARYLHIRRVR